jgi:hypothetical protein
MLSGESVYCLGKVEQVRKNMLFAREIFVQSQNTTGARITITFLSVSITSIAAATARCTS